MIELLSIQTCVSEREARELFISSLMIQIDELNQDRYQQMSYVEFTEFLARLAERYFQNQEGGSRKNSQRLN